MQAKRPTALTGSGSLCSYRDLAVLYSRHRSEIGKIVGCNTIGVTCKMHATGGANHYTYCPILIQVLAKYLWNHMTPWLRNDVNFVTHAEEAFEGSPFLGLHVRRGDKIGREATAVDVKVRSAYKCVPELNNGVAPKLTTPPL